MAEVKLQNLTKVFDKSNVVVKNLNLEIKEGEFLVLVGPSGCGKSTTLRMLAGLEEVSEGKVFIGEKEVTKIAPKDRDIAMVFQNYALYPHMNVYDNMAFGLKLRKYSKDDIKSRVVAAAEILDIKSLLDRRPKQLSGGERQRVALGRAMVRNPKVYLFDEPLSNLDAKLRVQMRVEIKKLHQRMKTTMVYVTHDQIEAMTMGDRIAVMKDGVLQQLDTPIVLYQKPVNVFVANFIGSPSMNLLKFKVSGNSEIRDIEGTITIKITKEINAKLSAYSGKNIILGIRPEHLYLDQKTGTTPLKVKVDLIDFIGDEMFLYVIFNNKKMTVKTKATERANIPEMILIYIDIEKAHFFDETTNIRID